MTKGSNDLNMLLKTKVVKIRAELDLKESMPVIRKQVDTITEKLKNKPVKLKVQLDYKLTELRTQLRTLQNNLLNTKTIKPIKVGVEIDVKGSAEAIKSQLKDVYQTVEDFNKKYGKQLQEMQKKTQEAQKIASGKGGGQTPKTTGFNSTDAPVDGFNTKAYVSQLKEVEQQMRKTFGKGIFSSHEFKDAEGNLQGFITKLTKADGVVQQLKYQWSKDKGKFELINQQSITNSEQAIKKARESLRGLRADLEKLQKGQGKNNLIKEWETLNKQGKGGTLTADHVNDLRAKIKEENVLEKNVKSTNQALHERDVLLNRIQKTLRANKSVATEGEYRALMKQTRKASNNEDPALEYKRIGLELDKLNDKDKRSIDIQKDHVAVRKERRKIQQELNKIERSIANDDPNANRRRWAVEELRLLTMQIRKTEDLEKVRTRLSNVKNNKILDDEQKRARNQLEELKALEKSLKHHGINTKRYEADLARLQTRGNGKDRMFLEHAEVDSALKKYQRMLQAHKTKIQHTKNDIARGIDITSRFGGAEQAGMIQRMLFGGQTDAKSMNQLQQFIGGVENAKVATLSFGKEGVDPTGKRMKTLVATMESSGKTAKQVTYGIVEGMNQIRQIGDPMQVFNANRNLGVFEQLKIAMARVPVWMGAMTAFYGSIRSVRAMTREIIEIDTSLTKIARVSGAHVNLETIFKGAVNLSKELGNNVHDILGSLEEFARTYGDFNERQLLAITKTVTLMSNVSDLSAQEATSSLVGTMNAFNISAEESIRIVDALNEVDNNYAISTKQLAEGMMKSASTAKTFGITLEENIGNITAIGSVTMESGKQIGNGLKTIYSRITTLSKAEDVLNDVGVAVRKIGENGEEYVRPVNDILKELAGKWYDLSDAQRQQIAVDVAGRYQLTRFLALMNNYDIALNSTRTAIHSQGSAMRENAEYMKSFEARLNQLKNSFTGLALAVGDAVLTNSMLVIIESLKDLAEFSAKVSKEMGVLPPILLGISLVMGKMKMLGGVHTWFSSGLSLLSVEGRKARDEMKKAEVQARATQLAMGGIGNTAKTSFAQATLSARIFGVTIKSVLASTGIGLVFVGLGILIEKVVKNFADAKRNAEEMQKINDQMISSYRRLGDQGIEDLINKYDKLHKKMSGNKENLSPTELQEYLDVVAEISNSLPTAVHYIDAQGNAHLKTTQQIKEQIEFTKKLSQIDAQKTVNEYNKTIREQEQSYKDVAKALEDLKKKEAELTEEHGKSKNKRYNSKSYHAVGGANNLQGTTVDNTDKLLELERDRLLLQAELTEAIQSTVIITQQASFAFLESEGHIKNLGDTQQKAIEIAISYNEEMLRSTENSEESQLKLYELGKTVGETFSKIREELTKGIEDPLRINEIEKNFNSLTKIIPKDFFKLDKNRDVDKVVKDLERVFSITSKIGSEGGNFYTLVQALINAGIEANLAGNIIHDLAKEQKNSTLQAQAQAEGFEGLNDELEELNKTMTETVDLTKVLFGESGNEFNAIKSHIEAIEALRHLYGGEVAEGLESYKKSEEAIAEALGISTKLVTEKRHELWNILDVMSKLTVKTDEHGDTLIDHSNLNEKQVKIYQDWMKTAKEKGEELSWIEYIYKKLGVEIEESNVKVEKSMSSVEERVESLRRVTNSMKEDMNEETKNLFLHKVRQDLNQIEGQISIVEDDIGKFKFQMSDGSKSAYLDFLNEQIDEFGFKINVADNDLGGFKVSLNNSSGSSDVLIEATEKTEKFISTINKADEAVSKAMGNKTPLDFPYLKTSEKTQEKAKEEIKTFEDLMGTYKNVKKEVTTDFGQMHTSVQENSLNMIKLHGNQKLAIENLADSARKAKKDIDDLNKTKPQQSRSSFNFGNLGSFSPFGGTSGTYTDGDFGAFSLSTGDGEGGVGGSGTGTSGRLIGSVDADGQYGIFSALSGDRERAELFRPNHNERALTVYGGLLRQLETRMQRITQNTKEYRDALKKVVHYQNINLDLSKKELKNTIDRQRVIEDRLRKLSDLKNHTNEQREEYNKLQQEYENNSSKVASLRAEVEGILNDIKAKSTQIFFDFIDEIVGKYDKTLKTIRDKTSDLQFQLDVLQLVNPDDVEGQLKLVKEQVHQFHKEQDALSKEYSNLEIEYNKAVKAYGAKSEQAKKVADELDRVKKSWQDAVLSGLKAEQQFKDIRAKVADDGIKQLRDYYSKVKDMAVRAIEEEQKHLRKAHEENMKMYDERIAKINEIYDNRFKEIDKANAEDDHQEQLSEKTVKRDELASRISLLSRSDTLEDRKRLAELQKQLEEAEKDISNFIKQRQQTLLKEQLEEQRQAQIKGLEEQKKVETEAFDNKIDLLDKEKEAVSKHYDDILNDEKRWATIREQFIKGNFKLLSDEIKKMNIDLEKFNQGNFNSLTTSFRNFSEEVKATIAEMNRLELSNLSFGSNSVTNAVKQTSSVSSPTATTTPSSAIPPQNHADLIAGKMFEVIRKAKIGEPLSNPTSTKNEMYSRIKSSSLTKNILDEILRKAVTGTPLDTPTPEKDSFYDYFKKLLNMNISSFATGGYTGSWGNNGKLGILHEKELILNKGQTQDLLDVMKIMEKVLSVMPVLKRNQISSQNLSDIKGSGNNIYELNVNIDKLNGNKESANMVVKEIMKGIKKMGG